MFVIDASALILCTNADRPEWAVAVHLAKRQGLHAPAILSSEVSHVVHRKRPQEFGPTVLDRTAFVELLLEETVIAGPDAAQRATAAQVSEAGLSFYDAEYVALAAQSSFTLVTHDAKMQRVAVQVLGPDCVLDLDGLRGRMATSAA